MSKSKNPQVNKMIARVMKKRGVSEAEAIEYMLTVATGRLAALWRYDDSLPEGKTSKGILVPKGNRKRAERSKPVKSVAPKAAAEAKAS